ncbi:hypothetical protein TNCV_1748831 [Trichonephila clavipes]|nr:hypothetical protein TNCV_1748831 [Trichonephila clavipes]
MYRRASSRKSSCEVGGRPLTTPRVSFLKIGLGNGPNYTVTSMVLKDTDNDRRHLALYHDEFHDLAFADQMALETTATSPCKVKR